MDVRDIAPLLRWHVGSPVDSVAISNDGTQIASGSADCLVRIWDMHTGALLQAPLKGHTNWVRSVAWSHDDTRVISGSYDNMIRIWDVRTGVPTSTLAMGHTDLVLSIALSSDSTRIVSGSYDETIRIWDTRTGSIIGKPLRGHGRAVYSVIFSHDSTRIISGSLDKTIRVWDALTGAPIGEPLMGHTDTILSLALSPNNTRIVSGSLDKTIRIWDARTGALIGEPVTGHTGAVLSVALSPDNNSIVSGSIDNTVRLWDARTGASKKDLLKGHTGTVCSVAFSYDGSHIVSGSGDGTVCAWVAPQNTPTFDKVRSDMSTEEMFECLVQHGCTDLSSLLSGGQYSGMPIANGGFGDVWRVTLSGGILIGSTVLAVKTLRLRSLLEGNNKATKRAAREVHHWSKLRHPNVQELMGIVVYQGGLGMVSPWLQNGHIQQYLTEHPDVPRYPLCMQLAAGVSYLHRVNMVHGDLKANNILVSDEGILKINDFDHAVLSEGTLRFSTTTRPGGGTIRWMAPELLLSDGDEEEEDSQLEAVRSKETDIYALGMTMLEILTGSVPYNEYQQDLGVYHAIDTRRPPRRPQQLSGPDTRAVSMWELLLRCWNHNPSARPSAGSVLALLRSFAV